MRSAPPALMRWSLFVVFVTAACQVGAPAADDDGSSDDAADAGETPDATSPPPLWVELSEPVVHAGGGDAEAPASDLLAPDARAGDGGVVRVHASGAVTIDATLMAPAAPVPTASPGPTIVITTADLIADVTRAETLRIEGDVTSAGGDAARTITSTSGDIVIDGTLRSGAAGGARQSLMLQAPAGRVIIAGTVVTGDPAASDGSAAGALTIEARSIVVAGDLLAAGASASTGISDPTGGAGGAITLVASAGDIWLGGTIDSLGGDARTVPGATVPDATHVMGGAAGSIAIRAAGALDLAAVARLRGGATASGGMNATGGAAGVLTLDSGGTLRVGGVIDARGGLARVDHGGGLAIAGASGSVKIGERARPPTVELAMPIEAPGGRGLTRGGDGGEIELTASGADLTILSFVRVDGGASNDDPGDAGRFHGIAGSTAGSMRLSAAVLGVGGASLGRTADGGTGAIVILEVKSRTGDLDVTASGELLLDGGTAAGDGTAGGGGEISMKTVDGDGTIAGRIIARGGAAPAGSGGTGGRINFLTDANFNGVGGDLLVDTSGVIDVSGGAGLQGGSARNNGGGGVALFPVGEQDIAVLLNSDGLSPGTPQDADLLNLGLIVARGGADDGWGGDIMFHGRRPDSFENPLPGELSLEGDGSGRDGDFAAE